MTTKTDYSTKSETSRLLDMLGDFDPDCENDNPVYQILIARYSPRNAALILLQNPDATEVNAYGAWKSKGRQVRKGEKSIRILAPAGSKTIKESTNTDPELIRTFFKAVSIFDISQTDPA